MFLSHRAIEHTLRGRKGMRERTERCPTTINFHQEVYERIKRQARKEDVSLTELIERILREHWEGK